MLKRFLPAIALVLGIGCREHPAAPTAAAQAEATPVTNSAAAPTPTTGEKVGSDPAQIATVLSALTQAVRKYAVEQRRVPKSFDEIVAAGYLSATPQAPAGKKFTIDKNLQVNLSGR